MALLMPHKIERNIEEVTLSFDPKGKIQDVKMI
jgi:hypothetical protein